MIDTTLDHVHRLIEQLTPLEQVRLLEYLASRIAQGVADSYQHAPAPTHATEQAWAEFFRVGDALTMTDLGDGDTLTASVLAMR